MVTIVFSKAQPYLLMAVNGFFDVVTIERMARFLSLLMLSPPNTKI